MANTLRVNDLPQILRSYDLRAPEEQPPEDERCFVCRSSWTGASSQSDTSHNGSGTTCEPARIHPCGHWVGRKCFHRLANSGMDQCQFCRSGVTVLADPCPQWLRLLVTSYWFKTQIAFLYKVFDFEEHRQLAEELLVGTLSVARSNDFLAWLAVASAFQHALFFAAPIFVWLNFRICSWIFRTDLPELWLFRLLTGTPADIYSNDARYSAVLWNICMSLALLHVARDGGARARLVAFGASLFIGRIVILMLGLGGVLLLFVASFGLYVLAARSLVKLGMQFRSRG
ncbi:hypothetical protein BCR34DRAFT_583789 [Clohesyomyces aquaticus]|uniref:RING-type domain-containing protein n=1 Tax=Clohesyomyces aquaticus TaxID=1231657 RepID=A0A1Y2A4B2_9PLEO|nr:hypothetical protein BCR34DRAFT_583789 [Clohesyomyces aquaticus]